MLHNDFSHDYEVIVNPELPGTGKWNIPELYIPRGFKPKPNKSHLILKFDIDHTRQIWHIDAAPNSEIWTTPDPNRILIDSIEGVLYVSTKNPLNIIKVELYDLHVTSAKDFGLLLLNDYFTVLALDSTGIRWQTPPLFSDDMTIEKIDGNKAICTGLSMQSVYKEAKVLLDISTGKVLEEIGSQPYKPSFWSQFPCLLRRSKKLKNPDIKNLN